MVHESIESFLEYILHFVVLHFIVLLVLPVVVLLQILVLVLPFQLRIQLRVVLYVERVARFLWQQRQDGFGKLRL